MLGDLGRTPKYKVEQAQRCNKLDYQIIEFSPRYGLQKHSLSSLDGHQLDSVTSRDVIHSLLIAQDLRSNELHT